MRVDGVVVRPVIVLVSVLALVMAACSGDDAGSAEEDDDGVEAADPAPDDEDDGSEPEPEDGDDESSAAPVQGISEDNVVTIGGWIAQSGPLGFVGAIREALALRLDIANEQGGINGYTFEYLDIDDQADASQTTSAVRQLWESDEVFALVHPYGSGGLTAVDSYLRDNDVPVLFPFADSRIQFGEGIEPPRNSFGMIPYYSDVIDLMIAQAVGADGIETLAVLHTNDPLGEAGPLGAEDSADHHGIEIVERIGYDSGETNFAPLGRRIAASEADAVLIWSFAGPSQVMEAALESGYEGVFLLHDGYRGGPYFAQLLDLPYDLDGRAYTNVYWVPWAEDDPVASEYREAFLEAYPEGDVNTGQSGWVAASLFLDAVEEATADGEPLTFEALREVLVSWEDRDSGGAVGITFAEDQRAGATRGLVRRLEGGDWVDATEWELYRRYR